jgi:hypothetical protein
MNKRQFQKNLHQWVSLRPIAKRRDHETGARLDPIDDQWAVEAVTDAGVQIKNSRTDHVKLLGWDNLREYRTPGFLLLRCQLTLRGPAVLVEPIVGP